MYAFKVHEILRGRNWPGGMHDKHVGILRQSIHAHTRGHSPGEKNVADGLSQNAASQVHDSCKMMHVHPSLPNSTHVYIFFLHVVDGV